MKTSLDSNYPGAPLPDRRDFLGGVLAGTATLFVGALANAQTPVATAIHELRGNVRVNGERATRTTVIKPGDKVVTGSDGFIVFVIGKDAFMLRSRGELQIEPPAQGSLFFASLRLVTGALGAVFEPGRPRTIKVANVTAGIRGTGVYMETRGDGVYFCTCFGKVELGVEGAPNEREFIESTRHTPRLVHREPKDGALFLPAAFETHTDEEMDMLERCVGRRAPWVKA
jgi:hypothetical protein